MGRVQGHSIEEQYDLADQFEGVMESAVSQTVETWLSGVLNASGLTAAADPFTPSGGSIGTIWQNQIDGNLAPFIYQTYESSALAMAHDVAADAGIGVPNIPDEFTANYVNNVKNKMKGVSDDLWSNIRDEIAKGVANNESIPELADRIRQAGSITMPRALTVARTTVMSASNAGSFAQAMLLADDETMQKEWIATEDMRTRPDHAHADTQTVALTAKFTVGGWTMDHPGDPTAPAGEVINCRCTLAYNFDGPPKVTCECGEEAVLAAIYAHPSATPTTVATTSCACPPTSLHTNYTKTSHIDPFISEKEKLEFLQALQGSQKVTPAYGGAKIHKQLEAAKKSFGFHENVSNIDILKSVDEVWKGKGSYLAKYEEWLDNAGAKFKPVSLAPSVAPAAPVVTEATTAYSDDVLGDIYWNIHANVEDMSMSFDDAVTAFKNYSATATQYGGDLKKALDDPNLVELLQTYASDHALPNSWLPSVVGEVAPIVPSGVEATAAKYTDSLLKNLFKVFEDEMLHGKKLSYNDAVAELISAYGDAGKIGELLKEQDLLDVLKYTAKKNGFDDSFLPATAKEAATVEEAAAPATAAIDPFDISNVSPELAQKLFTIFKNNKPVLPNWGGSAVYKNLQAIKPMLGPEFDNLNDGQLLKLLDEAYTPAKTASPKTFFDETHSWLKTANGKKYLKEHSLPELPEPVAGAPTVTPITASKDLGDITNVDTSLKQLVFQKSKGQSLYLSSPGSKIWDTVQYVKKNVPGAENLNDLQIVRIIDEQSALKFGVKDEHLYEEKLTSWMKTKSGKDYIASGGKPAYTPSYGSSPSYSPGKPINLAEIDRPISTADETFNDISVHDAQMMQDRLEPWTSSQQSALKTYTGSSYHDMNTALRNESNVSDSIARNIKNAQAGMRPSDRPFVVYRGTGLKQLGLSNYSSEEDALSLVGKTLQDKGFMSTSAGGRAAFGGDVTLRIECPTGTPMAFVKSISHYNSENEMILAAGTKYKVISVVNTGGPYSLRLQVTVRVVR